MKTQLITLTAVMALATAFAEATSRSLYWTNSLGGAFSTAANWLQDNTTEVSTGPAAADTVRFRNIGFATSSDYTVTLEADATVSNLEYRVTGKNGKTTWDLNDKVLTVDSDLQLFTQGNNTDGAELTIKDGEIRVINSFGGTSTYGTPNEDRSGFFVNRAAAQNGGMRAIFDNVDFDIQSKNKTMFNFSTLYGGKHYVVFTNGATLASLNMQISSGPVSGSVRLILDGSGTRIDVDDRDNPTTTLSDHGMLTVILNGDSEMEFRNGAQLHTARLEKSGSSPVIMNGGEHTFRGLENWGNHAAITVSAGALILTNAAKVAYGSNGKGFVRSNGSGKIYVGPDCCLTNISDNFYLYLGQLQSGDPAGGGILEVDGGLVTAPWLRFGGQLAGSNAVVRIRGTHARIEQKNPKEWGTDKPMQISYGCGLEYELPATGFTDDKGVARAPLYVNGCITNTTAAGLRSSYLKLNTRAFDKQHPNETLKLIETTQKTNSVGNDTTVFYQLMIDNVQWENNRHGTLSISDDGKSLLYTAPIRTGMIVILR